MKNSFLQILIIVATVVSFSCNSRNEHLNVPAVSDTIKKIPVPNNKYLAPESDTTSQGIKFSLDNFKKIPDEIDGCACYFSANEQSFKNREYVYAAGYDSIAFVSINHKFIKLRMISSERNPDSFGDNDHIEIYKSKDFKVTVDIRYLESSGEETWRNTGTITIETESGQKFFKKFIGECGC